MTVDTISGHRDPQNEPVWAMQVIVDVSDKQALTSHDVAATVAQAVVQFRDATVRNETWMDATGRWERGRIRKIVRRAKNTKWDAAQQFDGLTVDNGTVRARVLVPASVDDVPDEIRKLQVAHFDVPEIRQTIDIPNHEAPLLHVVPNPDLPLTTGKLAVQVAHAAHIIHMSLTERQRDAWRRNRFHVNVMPADTQRWDELCDDPENAVVRDAGFTEIPSGTQTCVANTYLLR